jgi:hypothetical protein
MLDEKLEIESQITERVDRRQPQPSRLGVRAVIVALDSRISAEPASVYDHRVVPT